MVKYDRRKGSKRQQGLATPKAPQNTKKLVVVIEPPATLEAAAEAGILK